MVKTLARGRQYMTDAYWSAVGMATATMLTMQPVLATATGTGTIWARFSTILKDVYGQIVAISTIVAVTVAAIALMVWERQPSRIFERSRARISRNF